MHSDEYIQWTSVEDYTAGSEQLWKSADTRHKHITAALW